VLALIAHDAKKDEIVQLVKAHLTGMAEIDLIATHSTGQYIEKRTGRPVTLVLSGPLGGDQQDRRAGGKRRSRCGDLSTRSAHCPSA